MMVLAGLEGRATSYESFVVNSILKSKPGRSLREVKYWNRLLREVWGCRLGEYSKPEW